MASDSTANLAKTAVTRVLAYQNDGGADVGDYVSDRVYVGRAPDNPSGTYIVLRLINIEDDPEYPQGLRLEFDVEITVYGRGASKAQEVETVLDLAEEALLTWHESSAANGLTYGMRLQRETEPLDTDPEDRTLVAARSAVRCGSWPKRLSNALT